MGLQIFILSEFDLHVGFENSRFASFSRPCLSLKNVNSQAVTWMSTEDESAKGTKRKADKLSETKSDDSKRKPNSEPSAKKRKKDTQDSGSSSSGSSDDESESDDDKSKRSKKPSKSKRPPSKKKPAKRDKDDDEVMSDASGSDGSGSDSGSGSGSGSGSDSGSDSDGSSELSGSGSDRESKSSDDDDQGTDKSDDDKEEPETTIKETFQCSVCANEFENVDETTKRYILSLIVLHPGVYSDDELKNKNFYNTTREQVISGTHQCVGCGKYPVWELQHEALFTGKTMEEVKTIAEKEAAEASKAPIVDDVKTGNSKDVSASASVSASESEPTAISNGSNTSEITQAAASNDDMNQKSRDSITTDPLKVTGAATTM
jgi:hypothetical protein